SRMWKPYPIRIKVGKPLVFSRYAGLEGDRFVERSITDEIMYELMELSGQEYVDIYAAKAKELQAAEDEPTPLPTRAQRLAYDVDRVPETEAG
ncbi:MAG: 1-acyl-sn-glycerol-3-phosphate acyltransferase, partial [Actinomycetota bacterium]|nr:1-acyl-sn-glycerol-3-phosphate acyltransferase [Actinomycetota bacterium]